MKRIYKYEIFVQDYQMFRLPKHSEILTVQVQREVQREVPQMWVVIDMEEIELEERHFFLANTGQDLPEDIGSMTYINSFQIKNLVSHLFEFHLPRIIDQYSWNGRGLKRL